MTPNDGLRQEVSRSSQTNYLKISRLKLETLLRTFAPFNIKLKSAQHSTFQLHNNCCVHIFSLFPFQFRLASEIKRRKSSPKIIK